MELKVVCQCGQKYKFDVEPVNGRMPFTVNCPVCNQDGTFAANVMLTEVLANQPPPLVTAAPATPATASTILPTPQTVGSSASGLRINRPESVQAAPRETISASRPSTIRPVAATRTASDSVRKLEWYEHIWCALPLCLVAFGGAIGGGCGGLAWAINCQIFRKMTNPVLRYLLTALISVAAFGLYLVAAVLLVLAFHRHR